MEGVERALAPVKGHRMAKAALTGAVLDARLRARQISLVDHLVSMSTAAAARSWVAPASVPSGVAVGVAGGLDALVEEVGTRVDEGYRRVKIKISPGLGRDPGARRCGPRSATALALQVDANGSYAALGVDEAAGRLRALDDHGLLLIEQPLGDDDLVGHASLARRLRTPVCLDESIASVDDAAAAAGPGSVRGDQRQGRTGRRAGPGGRRPRPVRGRRRAGVVRRLARDRRGAGRQPGPGRPPELLPAG